MNKIVNYNTYKISRLNVVQTLLKFRIFSPEEEQGDIVDAELDAILGDIPKYQPKEIDGPVFQILRCSICEYNNIISPPPLSLDDVSCTECGQPFNGGME